MIVPIFGGSPLFARGEKTPTPKISALLRKRPVLLRANFVLTKDRKQPYYGHFCGKYTGRGLVVKQPGVLSKVQMLNLVLGVGVYMREIGTMWQIRVLTGKPCTFSSKMGHFRRFWHYKDRERLSRGLDVKWHIPSTCLDTSRKWCSTGITA